MNRALVRRGCWTVYGGVDPSDHGHASTGASVAGQGSFRGSELMRLFCPVDAGGQHLGWVDDAVAAKIERSGRLANQRRPWRAL